MCKYTIPGWFFGMIMIIDAIWEMGPIFIPSFQPENPSLQHPDAIFFGWFVAPRSAKELIQKETTSLSTKNLCNICIINIYVYVIHVCTLYIHIIYNWIQQYSIPELPATKTDPNIDNLEKSRSGSKLYRWNSGISALVRICQISSSCASSSSLQACGKSVSNYRMFIDLIWQAIWQSQIF